MLTPITWLAAELRCGCFEDDALLLAARPLQPAWTGWNPFTLSYQSDDEAWAWSGPWDL